MYVGSSSTLMRADGGVRADLVDVGVHPRHEAVHEARRPGRRRRPSRTSRRRPRAGRAGSIEVGLRRALHELDALVHARLADHVNERGGRVDAARAGAVHLQLQRHRERGVVAGRAATRRRRADRPAVSCATVPGVDERLLVDVLAQPLVRGLVDEARAAVPRWFTFLAKMVWPPALKMRPAPLALMVCGRVPRLTNLAYQMASTMARRAVADCGP